MKNGVRNMTSRNYRLWGVMENGIWGVINSKFRLQMAKGKRLQMKISREVIFELPNNFRGNHAGSPITIDRSKEKNLDPASPLGNFMHLS